MRDDSLVEPYCVEELFIDDIAQAKVVGGIYSCALIRIQDDERGIPQRVVKLRLLMRATDVPRIQALTRAALETSILTGGREIEVARKLPN